MNKSNVAKTRELDLCVSCGICKASCPKNAIVMEYNSGQFFPKIDKKKCVNCGLCLKTCPGIDLDYLNLRNRNSLTEDAFVGKLIESYTVHSNNTGIRKKSASGGFITTLIIELIKKKEFDYAFVLVFDKYEYKLAKLKPVNNLEEILRSVKSKYIPASVGSVITELKKQNKKKYIIVGTPCQILGIKKYLQTDKISEDKLLFLGLFCDKTLNYNVVKYFKDKYCNPDEKIKKIDFRTKEKCGWPGNSKISFASKREIFINRNVRIQIKKFFQLQRCLFCVDKLNQLADISCGDCYIKGKSSFQGRSNIIVRTQKGKKIFDKYSKLFTFEKEDINNIKKSQKILNRKDNLEYAKIFIKKHGLYDGFQNRKIDSQAKKELSKLRTYISWGKNYNIKKIKSSLFLLKKRNETRKMKRYFLEGVLIIVLILKTIFVNKNKKKSDSNQSLSENIVVFGGNLANKGSQAMLFTAINQLKKKFPNKKIYLFSKTKYDQKYIEKNIYKFDIIAWDFKAKKEFLSLPKNKKVERIISNTYFFVDISGYALSSKIGFYTSFNYLLNIIIAKKYSIPYYIFPQSIGPFDYSFAHKIVLYPLMSLYLKYPKKIFVREKEGLKYINKFTKKNIGESFDIVLQNKKYDLTNIYKKEIHLKKVNIKPSSVAIIPNLKVFERINSVKFYSIYEHLIKILIKEKRLVYLLRHSYEDLEMCEKIKEQFSNNNNVVLITDDFNVIELENIIKQFDFIITSRYHSIIHSYKYGVPALVIGWAVKYHALLEKFGQLNYYFDINNGLNINKIENGLDEIIENYKEESEQITNKMNNLNLECKKYF